MSEKKLEGRIECSPSYLQSPTVTTGMAESVPLEVGLGWRGQESL
jgi:hypothetical protein